MVMPGEPRHVAPDAPAVLFERVCFAYAPGPLTLQNVSLRVAQGERLGLLGPNGSGKSTMLRLMLGLLRPDSGTVRVLGMTPAGAARRALVGYLPQRTEAELNFPLTVRQVVEMPAMRGLSPWQRAGVAVRARVDRLVEMVGAAPYADTPVGRLSGGQLQRAFIARALASEPRVLALDEPMIGVDPGGQERFADLMRTLHAQLGLTICIVSHDLRSIAATCDRVACLARTLHEHGGSPTGLTPEVLAEIFHHDVAGLASEGARAPGSHEHDPAHEHGAPVEAGIKGAEA